MSRPIVYLDFIEIDLLDTGEVFLRYISTSLHQWIMLAYDTVHVVSHLPDTENRQ